ncbi:MAG: deoxyribonuclease V [Thiohalospira sp.]
MADSPNRRIAAARRLQRCLAGRVETADRLGPVTRVAGVDVGFEEGGQTARAAAVVLAWPGLETLETAIAREPVRLPYIPGLLSFREVPVIAAALGRLSAPPDLIVCDGQGIAHPRRLGVASHLGLRLGIPTIGVAKSRLIGEHGPVPEERGGRAALTDGDEVIGAVVRTRTGVRPVYVSPGHRVGLETAVAWTLALAPRYRLPETTRRADAAASGKRIREAFPL